MTRQKDLLSKGHKFPSPFPVRFCFCATPVAQSRDPHQNFVRNSKIFSDEEQNRARDPSFILDMVELKGMEACASKNLADGILKTLQKYDIDLDQIVEIKTGVGLNKTEKNASAGDVNDEHELTEEESNSTYLENINDLVKPLDLRVEHIQIGRCTANTAFLCTLDVTKDADIKEFLINCRNLTKFIRKPSNDFKDAFELRSLSIPQLDCSTEFGSTYTMIQTLFAAKDVLVAVKSVSDKSDDENFDNTDALWDFIESYAKVFGPLQETIVKFQTEQLHYGNFYAQWLKCKILTSRIVETNTNDDVLIKIGTKLLESIEKRTSELLENENLNACLFLDPRFHHTLTSDNKQKAIVYLKHLWETQISISAAPNQTAGETVNIDVHSKIANLHLPSVQSDTDILHYWEERKHSDPELYKLSNKCFDVPSTQVPKESTIFSKLTFTENRNGVNHIYLVDVMLVEIK